MTDHTFPVDIIENRKKLQKSIPKLEEQPWLDCFVAVLNGYLRKDNIDIYVTGSNARLLSKDAATEFAGRGDLAGH